MLEQNYANTSRGCERSHDQRMLFSGPAGQIPQAVRPCLGSIWTPGDSCCRTNRIQSMATQSMPEPTTVRHRFRV